MITARLVAALLLFLPPMALAQECPLVTTVLTTNTLRWEAPVLSSDLVLHGYVLERQVDTDAWVALPPLPPTTTTTSDGPLAPGHTYRYRLAAQVRTQENIVAQSGWAPYGSPSPCVKVELVPPPLNFRGARE